MKKVNLYEDWAYNPEIGDEVLVRGCIPWVEAGALDPEFNCTEIEDHEYEILMNSDEDDCEWQAILDKYWNS